jgi:hypothetical protein
MDRGLQAVVAIGTAIIGLATLAVILSRNSATTDVVTSIGNAFGSAIKDAVSPITAGSSTGLGS